MLSNIVIENIAIIEYSSIDFTAGFNCMTGETGAGKSIIIDAIGAVLGEKTSRDLIRTNAYKAQVTALFTDISENTVNILESLGFQCEFDNSLLISRVIYKDGKNQCKINGKNATVSMLKTVGYSLINIHGQSDNQQLMNNELHYEFLDKLADNNDLLENYRYYLSVLHKIKGQIKNLTVNEAEKERQIDILSFQIDEIEKADIKIGEYDDLTKRKNAYLNSKKIVSHLSSALISLNGTDEFDGAVRMSFDAVDSLRSVTDFSKDAETISNTLSDCSYNLKDCATQIESLISEFDFSERELSDIEERLDLLYRMRKKYGETESEILEFLENSKTELETITLSNEKITELKEEYEINYEKCVQAAELLSESRMSVAKEFEDKITKELAFLDMPDVQFSVNRELVPFSDTGIDKIEFMISANKGENLKPLSKIASGGELARIMLAIKNVLSHKDEVSTLIFDEIDTGVSGKAAGKIGEKLFAVSKSHQVLCITHLPIIASFSDTHLKISKSTESDLTKTNVEILDVNGRIAEISRIICGSTTDIVQLDAARHMINDTVNIKVKYQ